MSSLLDIIQFDAEEPEEDMLDADYQANKFTVEQALRETGVLKAPTIYTRSPYDAALMRLIDAIPTR